MSFALTSARGEIIIGTDKARAAVRGLAGDLKGFASATSGAIGVGATAFGAVLAAGFGAGIAKAADFEHQMSAIKSVLSATDEEMAGLSESILKIGQDSSFTAGEVGQVAENLAKMGISAKDMMSGALQAVTDLSAATATAPATAANIIGQAMAQYQLAGDQAESVADLFTRTANTSAADIEGLGSSFTYVAGQAYNLGIPMEDLMTSLAIMADNGLQGSHAGTSLGRVFTTLLSPTRKSADAMAKYGIEALDASGNFVGLENVVRQLDKAFVGMTESQKQKALNEMFLTNGARALIPLLHAMTGEADAAGKGWEDYAIGVTTGLSASEQAEERLNNLQGSVEKFRGSIDTILIRIGGLFTGPLKGLVDLATMFTSAFGQMSDSSFKLAAALAAPIAAFGALRLAALLAYNPILRYVPGFEAFAAAAGKAAIPVAILTGGIALLGLAYSKNFGGLQDWVKNSEQKFKEMKRRYNELAHGFAGESMRNAILGFDDTAPMDSFLGKLHAMGIAIKEFTGIDMKKWLQEVGKGLLRFPKAFDKLKKQLNQVGDVIKDKGLIAGIKYFFGEGGKGVAEAFGDGISAVPKLFGDVLKNIKTGNKDLDHILDETGKSFTDFGRLIQELGQGDMDGFMVVLDRLVGRLGDLAKFTGGIVFDFFIDVASNVVDLTWDWILDELFGENDVLNSLGQNVGEPHKETLSDVIFEVGVRILAVFKGLFGEGMDKISDLAQWAANEITGMSSGPTGLYDAQGEQLRGGNATFKDVVFTIGVKVRAIFGGIIDAAGGAIGSLAEWADSLLNGQGGPPVGGGAGGYFGQPGGDVTTIDHTINILATIGQITWDGASDLAGAFVKYVGNPIIDQVPASVIFLAKIAHIAWEGASDIAAAIVAKIGPSVEAVYDDVKVVAKGEVTLGEGLSNLIETIDAMINGGGSGPIRAGFRPVAFQPAGARGVVEFTDWKLKIGAPGQGVEIDLASIWSFLWDKETIDMDESRLDQAHQIGYNWGKQAGDALTKGMGEFFSQDNGEELGKTTWDAVVNEFVKGFFYGFADSFGRAVVFKMMDIGVQLEGFIPLARELFYRGVKSFFGSVFKLGVADAMAAEAPFAGQEARDAILTGGETLDQTTMSDLLTGFLKGLFPAAGVIGSFDIPNPFAGLKDKIWGWLKDELPTLDDVKGHIPDWMTSFFNDPIGFMKSLVSGGGSGTKTNQSLVTGPDATGLFDPTTGDQLFGRIKDRAQREGESDQDYYNDVVVPLDPETGDPVENAAKRFGLDKGTVEKTIGYMTDNAGDLRAGAGKAIISSGNIKVPQLASVGPRMTKTFLGLSGLDNDTVRSSISHAQSQATVLRSGLESAQRMAIPSAAPTAPKPKFDSGLQQPAKPKMPELQPQSQSITTKISADASAFQATMNSVTLAAAAFENRMWITKLSANAGEFTNSYTSSWMAGEAFDAKTWEATFTLDYAPVVNGFIDAMEYGDTWDEKTFESTFDIDIGPAAVAYTNAWTFADAWDGHVFTAYFSIDTSGLDAAVAAAQRAAQTIANLMPHSPAKEGPLREPITFDYIGQNMSATMDGMISNTRAGVAELSALLRQSGMTPDMLNGGLVNRGNTSKSIEVNQFYINTLDPEHYTQLVEDARFGREFGEAYVQELDLME